MLGLFVSVWVPGAQQAVWVGSALAVGGGLCPSGLFRPGCVCVSWDSFRLLGLPYYQGGGVGFWEARGFCLIHSCHFPPSSMGKVHQVVDQEQGAPPFNYYSIIYNKYICYLCVQQCATVCNNGNPPLAISKA